MKVVGYITVGVVGLIAITLLGLGLGWFSGITNMATFENVKAQYQFAYDDIKAMDAVTGNVCSAVQTRDKYAVGSDTYAQIDSQVQAYEQNYRRIEAEYNSHMADMFRTKYVKPADVPAVAPTLEESMGIACPGTKP